MSARVVFDLDPAAAPSYADKDCVPFSKVKTIAESLRNVLKACGLESYVMLTGSIGLHVMAPLKQEKDFDFVHDFAHAVVILMQNIHPELVTASPKHDHRAGKIFIDYVRNSYNQTTVMPYSTRAQARAPVACPVAWDELPSITSSRQFDIESVQKRLKATDPWAAALDQQQIVPDAYPDILLECEKKSKN